MNNNANRLFNCSNPNQQNFKKVLCVCSAGLLRSPTAAVVLASPPYNYNTRAAGLDVGHALIPVDEVLLKWADEIVCMTEEQQERLIDLVSGMEWTDDRETNIICLSIPDSYCYRDPELIKLIQTNYDACLAADLQES